MSHEVFWGFNENQIDSRIHFLLYESTNGLPTFYKNCLSRKNLILEFIGLKNQVGVVRHVWACPK